MRALIDGLCCNRNCTLAAATLALAATMNLGAQSTPSHVMTFGVSAMTSADWYDELLPLVDFRFTKLGKRAAGVDFGLTVLPYAIIAPALAGAVEVGPAFPLVIAPDVRVLLRPGVGAVGVISPYMVGAIPEMYLGLGLVFGRVGSLALRLDGAAHQVGGIDNPLLLTFGLSVGGFGKEPR